MKPIISRKYFKQSCQPLIAAVILTSIKHTCHNIVDLCLNFLLDRQHKPITSSSSASASTSASASSASALATSSSVTGSTSASLSSSAATSSVLKIQGFEPVWQAYG